MCAAGLNASGRALPAGRPHAEEPSCCAPSCPAPAAAAMVSSHPAPREMQRAERRPPRPVCAAAVGRRHRRVPPPSVQTHPSRRRPPPACRTPRCRGTCTQLGAGLLSTQAGGGCGRAGTVPVPGGRAARGAAAAAHLMGNSTKRSGLSASSGSSATAGAGSVQEFKLAASCAARWPAGRGQPQRTHSPPMGLPRADRRLRRPRGPLTRDLVGGALAHTGCCCCLLEEGRGGAGGREERG